MGPDGGKRDADVVREYPWSLVAPFELHFAEFCIMLFDAPVCGDGIFCGSVNHGTLRFPAFY